MISPGRGRGGAVAAGREHLIRCGVYMDMASGFLAILGSDVNSEQPSLIKKCGWAENAIIRREGAEENSLRAEWTLGVGQRPESARGKRGLAHGLRTDPAKVLSKVSSATSRP